ncbi:MAG: DUF1538 domain-containing protein [Pseudaminobacter sp.]
MSEALLENLADTAVSVAAAILPLVALFVIFQLFLLRLPSSSVKEILLGTVLAAAGLFLFLLGISVGFLPFGRAIGTVIGSMREPWLIVPIGLFLGFVTAWGEPAVRILANQVEEASNGSVPGVLVLYAVCIGVAAWAALGLLRVSYGIPLLYLLLPGYLLAIVLIWLCDRDFVSIAIDAGGVATGPLTNTFLLALALGMSSSVADQDPVKDGLGFISFISLAPIVSVTALGLLVRRKTRARE